MLPEELLEATFADSTGGGESAQIVFSLPGAILPITREFQFHRQVFPPMSQRGAVAVLPDRRSRGQRAVALDLQFPWQCRIHARVIAFPQPPPPCRPGGAGLILQRGA